MLKFTTKIVEPTGRYRSFDHAYADVKFGRKECGTLSWVATGEIYGGYKLTLRVKKSNEDFLKNPGDANCPWKRITFKKIFSSFKEAKQWMNGGELERILKEGNYIIYFDE